MKKLIDYQAISIYKIFLIKIFFYLIKNYDDLFKRTHFYFFLSLSQYRMISFMKKLKAYVLG